MNRREIKDPLLLEVVITAVVAIILLLLKQFDLAIVATSIQILITFMTYAIPMKIKNEVYKNIDEHFKILKFSMSIEEEPFKGIKDKIIKDCEDQLELLEKGGVKGETYYIWLNEKINECEKNLKAISSMSCEQWEIPKERAYYAANRDARINRNCDIERIFIINIDELKDEKKRKIILKHLLDGIRVYIVSLGEHIPGMCIFDNKLILIDKEVPPIGVGGRL